MAKRHLVRPRLSASPKRSGLWPHSSGAHSSAGPSETSRTECLGAPGRGRPAGSPPPFHCCGPARARTTRSRAPHPLQPRGAGRGRGRCADGWDSLQLRAGSSAAMGARLGRRTRPEAGSEAGAAAGCGPAPFERRVRWLREIQSMLRERRPERARQLLRLLRQDLGLEGTLLTDILYRNVAFLNLVDPISHDLLVNLARDLQCPKTDYELWKSSDKICRQLIYHLTPHSKRQRGSSLPRRKTQSCLKSSLQMTQLAGETVNLSGIPLSARDVQHITRYLRSQGAGLTVLDLSFTGLSDELLRLLLPSLWSLPHLTQLLLNGNRLTRATARELTEAIKDSAKFPALAWVDLGNNVDVASLPQPLLVGLRRRLSQRTSLPTIYEGLDLEPEGGVAGAGSAASTWGSAATGPGSEPQACCMR
ncbi:LOW QUALITY PROTEIN: leucine-rich repeat-containing protein 75B [Mustela erminea]|uniref:LOW QUALITY PROTEIN: leucine-rich repeat-containing protein 75B n=1 Tax=Mustela erminea TaxID=36723 RepID=UPI001386E6AC|nr:LOW QUALITY PROTEIN: leucine-rich repeat-containing protein 75B [Mustela erminea]